MSIRIASILGVLCLLFFFSCNRKASLSVLNYYEYDKELPLKDSVEKIEESPKYSRSYITFYSVNNKKVTALLTVPEKKEKVPVVILLHGKGDEKEVDYIEYGDSVLRENGYAVLRPDIINHGDRFENDYDFSLTGEYRYWTRDIVTQTIFDLRRAVDFIATREELDSERIGFLGISLGGITGTIFSGVEQRIEVPVIVLAGGQMNLVYGAKALTSKTKDYLSVIEPNNFVEQISPRPLLMINAENDDVIPPLMSKLLYKEAKQPKKIIWYPAKHHTIPVDKTYNEAVVWFDRYLK